MFTSADNLLIVQTELDTVFFQEFEYEDSNPVMTRSTNDMLFKQVDFDKAVYIEAVNAGVTFFDEIGEVQTVPSDVPQVANKLSSPILDYAKKIEISKNLFDDNMHGVWEADVRDMAMKARITQDRTAFGVYRNAFTTQLTADGVSLINAAHPLIGGGTTSNLVSGALSSTTIDLAVISLAEQVDQRNVILGHQPTCLLVPPALIKTALEETDSALTAGDSTNAINVWRSAYGFRVYASPYLGAAAGGSDTAWFMLARNHGVKRVVRQGIETRLRDWQYSDNRTYLYQANYREVYISTDYAGVVGATGV